MTQRNYNNVTSIGTLSGPVASSATTLATASFTGFPAVPFTVTLDRNTASEEVCLVTGVSGANLTVTRGFDGTAGQAHSAGATVEHTAVALDYTEANLHVNATAAVHGVTGALVGAQGAQTIYDKTLISPVVQADVVNGDAVVAYVPSAASARNAFRAVGPAGTDVTVITSAGALSTAGITSTTTLRANGNTQLDGTLTVNGATTLTGATTATAAITANGGVVIPTGKKITLTDPPGVATDAANKNYVDGLGTAAATASQLVKRDGAGRAAFADPAAAGDAATKNYVDLKFATVALTALTINGLPASFSANAASPPGFRKLAGGQVVLEGAIDIANTSFSLGQAICTLPAGSRPGVPLSFVCHGPGTAGMWRADVSTAGVISYGAGLGTGNSTPGQLWLSGIQFYAVN